MPDYKEDLLKDLRKSPRYAAKYLSAAAADSPEAFLVALRDVADSQNGVAGVAAQAGVNRGKLYRKLSEGRNLRLQSLAAILKALRLRLSIEPLPSPKTPRQQAHH